MGVVLEAQGDVDGARAAYQRARLAGSDHGALSSMEQLLRPAVDVTPAP
jgi:hypothetical protein